MNDTLRSALTVVIASGVTVLLRFIPFAIFKNRKTPAAVSYLGKVLPFAVMGMLLVYCFKDVSFASVSGWVPYLVAGALTVITYVLSRKTLPAILAGTVCYMIFVQYIMKG